LGNAEWQAALGMDRSDVTFVTSRGTLGVGSFLTALTVSAHLPTLYE
jgi:hypothetical protein